MPPEPYLVDSHCHLDFPDYAEERDEVVARARRAGIGLMLTICTQVTRFEQVLALAERFPEIYCSVGIHPQEADEETEIEAQRLVELARHPKVVGFGETGLDFYRDNAPREIQEASFRAHIQAARETGLPVIIHSRDADPEMAEILRDEHAKGAFPGLIHCFTSGQELADIALELGLFISISGIVTFKNAEALRSVVRSVPLDRLLVETDAPFLAPVPMRGKRNEPSFVIHTAARVAEEKGVTAEDITRVTTQNFLGLFRKVVPA
jgi:TatD DNase family protein